MNRTHNPDNSVVHRIVHLTHTEPRNDSRILKAMAASRRAGFEPFALGVAAEDLGKQDQSDEKCVVLSLATRQGRFIPGAIRHLLVCLELYLRALPRILRAKPNIIHCNDVAVLPLAAFGKFLRGAVFSV